MVAKYNYLSNDRTPTRPKRKTPAGSETESNRRGNFSFIKMNHEVKYTRKFY
jgi:hypothetical protein